MATGENTRVVECCENILCYGNTCRKRRCSGRFRIQNIEELLRPPGDILGCASEDSSIHRHYRRKKSTRGSFIRSNSRCRDFGTEFTVEHFIEHLARVSRMDFSGRSESYYDILGVGLDSSYEEVRRAYRKLAMRWHPDKWEENQGLLEEAKLKFQRIQEAYSVLADESKRTLYDAGMYDTEDELGEGFADFVQEMFSLMQEVKREEKVYSLEELQGLFVEMSKGFESSLWYSDTSGFGGSVFNSSPVTKDNYNSVHQSKRARWDIDAGDSGIGLTSGYFS